MLPPAARIFLAADRKAERPVLLIYSRPARSMISRMSPLSMMAERCLSNVGEVWLSIRPLGAMMRLLPCRVSAMFMVILTSVCLLITLACAVGVLAGDDFRKLYDLPERFLKLRGMPT